MSWLCLLSIGVIRADADDFTSGTEIKLSCNEVPFQKSKGSDQEQRSIIVPIPISAFLSNKQSIELEFYGAIGNVEIIISQNGVTIYSSSENIESNFFESISLSQRLSGRCLLEIKGENGSYAFGYFEL